MNRLFVDLWYAFRNFLETFGAMQLFLLRILAYSPKTLFTRFRLISHEIYSIGAMSLVIILVCGLFVGMVLGLQGYDTLSQFGAEEGLGTAVAPILLKNSIDSSTLNSYKNLGILLIRK